MRITYGAEHGLGLERPSDLGRYRYGSEAPIAAALGTALAEAAGTAAAGAAAGAGTGAALGAIPSAAALTSGPALSSLLSAFGNPAGVAAGGISPMFASAAPAVMTDVAPMAAGATPAPVTIGTASAPLTGGAMTGLGGMGPETATASTPAFSEGGAPNKSKGLGDMMKGMGKSLGEGATSQTAANLMRAAAANRPAAGSPPSLPSRGGSATQPSVQQFLRLLSQRPAVGLRMGG